MIPSFFSSSVASCSTNGSARGCLLSSTGKVLSALTGKHEQRRIMVNR